MEDTLNCNQSCKVCCIETVEEMNAKSDAQLRRWAFFLSTVVTISILASYIYIFATTGKILPIPEIVWGIALAPLCGASLGKLAELLASKK